MSIWEQPDNHQLLSLFFRYPSQFWPFDTPLDRANNGLAAVTAAQLKGAWQLATRLRTLRTETAFRPNCGRSVQLATWAIYQFHLHTLKPAAAMRNQGQGVFTFPCLGLKLDSSRGTVVRPIGDERYAVAFGRLSLTARFYRISLTVILIMMGAEFVAALAAERWLTAFLVASLALAIVTPVVFKTKFSATVPLELQLFATLFIFATLFLGEVRDFYNRFWWWDLALHTTSGILLGLLGFLIVYLLNETRRVDFALTPTFVALFAFSFAVCIGAIWEIFEFAMDALAGTTMQKPMFNDPSGKIDTMWDLIVDAIGALAVSLAGWRYMIRANHNKTDHWLRRFVERHQRFFDGQSS